jgi:hypothetical protein
VWLTLLRVSASAAPPTPGPQTRAWATNTGTSEDLVLIEAQTGSYFGEDDIIRLDDDYGRCRHGPVS